MFKIDNSDYPILTEAVIIWIGGGRTMMPYRDDARLINHFGVETASKLLPILKSLADDFYSSEAWKVAANLQEMGEMAARDFKKKHPEIPDQIIQAFVQCYTFDYK